MTERPTAVIGRRSARAILIDEDGYLVLIRRTRPGRARYWTTVGGGVEDDDESVEAAMHRELAEELGAKVTGAVQVFLVSSWSAAGLAIAHFFLARLVSLDLAQRSGPEFDDPANGAYDIDRIDLRGDDLAAVDLHPVALKMFIMDNRAALLAEASSEMLTSEIPYWGVSEAVRDAHDRSTETSKIVTGQVAVGSGTDAGANQSPWLRRPDG